MGYSNESSPNVVYLEIRKLMSCKILIGSATNSSSLILSVAMQEFRGHIVAIRVDEKVDNFTKYRAKQQIQPCTESTTDNFAATARTDGIVVLQYLH